MLTSTAVVAFSTLLVAHAHVQSTIPSSASAYDLALVDDEYVNSGLALQSLTGFGVSLKSEALLTVEYSFGAVQNGAAYSVSDVSGAPDVYITPSESTAAQFNASSLYTLTLADAASLGDPDAEGNYRHFLVNSLVGAAGSGGNMTFEPVNGTVATQYAAPGPIAGTGPHRYAWLLFTQPTSFSAPSFAEGTASGHWNVSSYVSETGLQLVAASFFTVENGNPTGSVVATSAVDTASLRSAISASSTASSATQAATSSAANSSSASAAASASTTASKSSAGAKSVASGSGTIAFVLAGAAAGIAAFVF